MKWVSRAADLAANSDFKDTAIDIKIIIIKKKEMLFPILRHDMTN